MKHALVRRNINTPSKLIVGVLFFSIVKKQQSIVLSCVINDADHKKSQLYLALVFQQNKNYGGRNF